MSHFTAHKGVGLIEVMVALAVFTVGILGTFGMQIEAKKANYQAAQRSLATNLARDIIERMRANRTELDAYAVDGFTGEGLPTGRDCALQQCTTIELAARDLDEWGSSLAGEQAVVAIDGKRIRSGGLVDPMACIENESGYVRLSISWLGSEQFSIEEPRDCGGGAPSSSGARSYLLLNTYIGRL